MRWLVVLASLGFACAGASPAPRPPCPECPRSTCPECPDATCPTCPTCTECPACPTCPTRYSEIPGGWYCVDDPPPKPGQQGHSYCFAGKLWCENAYKLYVKERPTVKPCRPHAPVYCFEWHSPQFQSARYYCHISMDHCEAAQRERLPKLEPEGDHRWTPCTEQP